VECFQQEGAQEREATGRELRMVQEEIAEPAEQVTAILSAVAVVEMTKEVMANKVLLKGLALMQCEMEKVMMT